MKKDHFSFIRFLIPDPYNEFWQELISLCIDIRATGNNIVSDTYWPIHALGIKSANTTLSIASLASMGLWADAIILSRSLFETEIIIKWLIQKNTKNRVREYLGEIGVEERRIQRKMDQGISVSLQFLKDLYTKEAFSAYSSKNSKFKKRLNVREKARRVAIDRSYDFHYWFQSIFAHSHALSISQWNQFLKDQNSPFITMFGNETTSFMSGLVLGISPVYNIDAVELVDNYFNLGLEKKIVSLRKSFRNLLSKTSKFNIEFTENIERGSLHIKSKDGVTKVYKPKKTGTDPLDQLYKKKID